MSLDARTRPALPDTDPGFSASALVRILIVVCGMFMITLDFFVVNVAIPAIRADLHAGAAAIEFMVSGFSLAYSASMITAGRLGDLYGRRRLFASGMVLFTLASLTAGL